MSARPAAEAGEDPGAAAARLTGRPVTGRRPLSATLTVVTLDGGRR
ncbi:Fructosamine kinase OS=Streptomyces antimycoticus OX=68175 GN=SANT12839_005220 PE=3 SV=1 [Streptomyces antimycoticus]